MRFVPSHVLRVIGGFTLIDISLAKRSGAEVVRVRKVNNAFDRDKKLDKEVGYIGNILQSAKNDPKSKRGGECFRSVG